MKRSVVLVLIFLLLVSGCDTKKEISDTIEESDITTVQEPRDLNYLDYSDIRIYHDCAVIDADNLKKSKVAGTGSMYPLIFSDSELLLKVPEKEDIQLDTIIVFERDDREKRTVHRVIGIESDAEGTYYETKGDNAKYPDNIKVRFENISYIVVGIIY